MRDSHPQTLSHVLDEANHLSNIQQRAAALNKLDRQVKALLPAAVHAEIRVANYRQQILVIEVSSAGWLTRMRYEQEKLLSTLRQQLLPALSKIQLVINPELQCQRYTLQTPTIARSLSPKSATVLQELAQQAPKKLRQKLIQLAQHAKRSNN